MCYLVRKMYTADEIKNKVPQLPPEVGDERLKKIKGIYFVSLNESAEDEFLH